jgi:hypothetical protein
MWISISYFLVLSSIIFNKIIEDIRNNQIPKICFMRWICEFKLYNLFYTLFLSIIIAKYLNLLV